MKKLYSLIFATLLALPLFAVSYQEPITVWEGNSTSVYYGIAYNLIIPQSTFDWTKLPENTRITIKLSQSVTENSYIYLYACQDLAAYENTENWKTTVLPIGTDDGGTYTIPDGESQYQFVLTKDDVTKFNTIPTFFALLYTNVDMTQVLVELPANSATALQSASVENIYAYQGTVVAPEAARIYSLTGQDVTSQNGHLQNGIYVVRAANKTVKVVVK